MQFIGNAECVHSVWVTVSPSHGGERPEKLTLNGPFLTHKPDQRKKKDPTNYKPHYSTIWKKPCSLGIFIDQHLMQPHVVEQRIQIPTKAQNLLFSKSIMYIP